MTDLTTVLAAGQTVRAYVKAVKGTKEKVFNLAAPDGGYVTTAYYSAPVAANGLGPFSFGRNTLTTAIIVAADITSNDLNLRYELDATSDPLPTGADPEVELALNGVIPAFTLDDTYSGTIVVKVISNYGTVAELSTTTTFDISVAEIFAAVDNLFANPTFGDCIRIGDTVSAVLTGDTASTWQWQSWNGSSWDDITGETTEDYIGDAAEDGLTVSCLIDGTYRTSGYVVRWPVPVLGDITTLPVFNFAQVEPDDPIEVNIGAGTNLTSALYAYTASSVDVLTDVVDLGGGDYEYTSDVDAALSAIVRFSNTGGDLFYEATALVNTLGTVSENSWNEGSSPPEWLLDLSEGGELHWAVLLASATVDEPTDITGATNTSTSVAGQLTVIADSAEVNPDLSELTANTYKRHAVLLDSSGEPGPILSSASFTVSTIPAAFGDSDWGVADAGTGGTLAVTISALPAANNSAITVVQYRVDGGTWTSSGGTSSFNITGLTDAVEYDIELRAVNGVGNGPASSVKSATPMAAVYAGPTLEAFGSSTAGTGGPTANWPTHTTGDWGILMQGGVASGNTAEPAVGTWTAVGTVNTGGTSGESELRTSRKTAASASEPGVALTDSGVLTMGRIINVRGASTVNVIGSGTGSGAASYVTGSYTVSHDDALVLILITIYAGTDDLEEVTAVSCAALGGALTGVHSGHSLSGNTLFCSNAAYAGEKAVAGSIGTFTITLDAAAPVTWQVLELY